MVSKAVQGATGTGETPKGNIGLWDPVVTK